MDFARRKVLLLGRFEVARADLTKQLEARGAQIVKPGARAAIVAVGSRSIAASVCRRILDCAKAGATIVSEQALLGALNGAPERVDATLPVSVASKGAITFAEANVLAAFDLIRLDGENCRFADAATLRAAGALEADGRQIDEIIEILRSVQSAKPKGPARLVTGPCGAPLLEWEGGQRTTVAGQGYLNLDTGEAAPDQLFAAALEAEEAGDTETAIRLYDLCVHADKKDWAAPFNLGNVLLSMHAWGRAAIAFQQAIARKANFAEAHYNLAVAHEKLGRTAAAKAALQTALGIEPNYSDALFNLAQLEMKSGALSSARALYEKYLALSPPTAWAGKARRALAYCCARLSA